MHFTIRIHLVIQQLKIREYSKFQTDGLKSFSPYHWYSLPHNSGSFHRLQVYQWLKWLIVKSGEWWIKTVVMLEIIIGLQNSITSHFLFLAILVFGYVIYLTFTALSQLQTQQQAYFKSPCPQTLGPFLFLCAPTKSMPSHTLQNRLHWNRAKNRSIQVAPIPTTRGRN